MPVSTMRPCSITTIRSQAAAWESRWAMISPVRPVSAASAAQSRRLAWGAGFGGGLVEDRQVRVGQHETGKSDLLGLRGGRFTVATAQACIQSVG